MKGRTHILEIFGVPYIGFIMHINHEKYGKHKYHSQGFIKNPFCESEFIRNLDERLRKNQRKNQG